MIAEFGLLDSELASLLEAVQDGHAARLDDDNLARLAVDIPDLRNRLGIGYGTLDIFKKSNLSDPPPPSPAALISALYLVRVTGDPNHDNYCTRSRVLKGT